MSDTVIGSSGVMDTTGAIPVRAPTVYGATEANRGWRIWVTRHPIAGALLSGFVATHIATIFGFWFPGIGLPQLDWPLVNGNVVLPKASPVVKFVVGEVFIHGLDGVVFTLIFALMIFPMLTRNCSPLANLAKGLAFGLVLATFSVGFMNPYVYFAHSGAGLFTTGFGWKVVFAVYLWHVVFGVMYNPMPLDAPELAQASS